ACAGAGDRQSGGAIGGRGRRSHACARRNPDRRNRQPAAAARRRLDWARRRAAVAAQIECDSCENSTDRTAIPRSVNVMSPTAHLITLAVPPEPTDHMLGSEHARVTVVEYGDFECPSCKVAAATPKLLLERFPNRIRFIFRHFPLQEAHPHALLAAEASEAAAAQGKFWPMHD